MKTNNISFGLRLFIVIFTVFSTILEVMYSFVKGAPDWFISFPRPLIYIRVLSWMFLEERLVFAFLLFEALCLLPAIGCIFVRKNRIIYSLTVLLPFGVSVVGLLFMMIFHMLSFSNYGLFWGVDIICLFISIWIYRVMEK